LQYPGQVQRRAHSRESLRLQDHRRRLHEDVPAEGGLLDGHPPGHQ
ncbi:hypothetical protein chiPu_0027005, partial [Chiloscyllium punctatum]|nr:hypothetical protein [Chiloscyllium punctatum]